MPASSVLGADTLGNALYAALKEVETQTIPDLEALTSDSLTTKTVDGTGVFDVLMQALNSHLQAEYNAGRISGDQYAKAYVGVTTAALQQAVVYLLGKDQAYWGALLAQKQVENARAQLAQIKMQMSVADAQYTLVTEQAEAKRAETMDTRIDGTTAIMGAIGKQKDLYTQQIDSYQKDAAFKVGKLFSDAWITQKTLDDNTLAPDNYTIAEIQEVLALLRSGVSLGS